MKNRPRITIEKESNDYLIEIVGWAGFAALIFLPLYYYGQLPDEIPMHFNAKGEVDSYGGKWTIWLLAAIGCVTYLGINFLQKFPHTFNYPVEITEENAAKQYRTGIQIIRVVNTMTVLIFAYIAWMIIQIGLGNNIGLGQHFVIVMVVGLLLAIGYFMRKSYKER